MPLLFDALRPRCALPDFPNLTSLHIFDSELNQSSESECREMSLVVVPFILHVHEKIKTLTWEHSMAEEVTKHITASHLPNLETFSGCSIRYLVRSHPLKRLELLYIRPQDIFNRTTGSSLLRETSSCSPGLSVLSVRPCIRTKALLSDLRTFTGLTELWYNEAPGVESDDDESWDERLYALDVVRKVVPILHKLRSLCITIHMDAMGTLLCDDDFDILRCMRTRSLLILTFQFVIESEQYIRYDVHRQKPKGRWKIRSFDGAHGMRKFIL
ncbi:hypothetical protein FRC17_003592 [Serendipita sp. 399]|nr:hypothetical protein FRC17_003592 [Serendipita sp. 399]